MSNEILLVDIETAPNLSWTWAKYEQDVIDFKTEWYMLSFAYKWLDSKTVQCKSLPDYKLYKKEPENDRDLVTDLWKLINEAKVVVAHNGDMFDIRKMNARFLYHGLTPPEPYKTVDTKKVAKQYFAFNSNKLDDLGQHLGLGKKVKTGGFTLWKGCLEGDKRSWDQMVEYNKGDITLLQDVYERLRPWMKTHPNMNNYKVGAVCPKCGSDHLQSRGFTKTLSSVFRRFQCQTCGGWSRVTTSEKDSKVKITNL